MVLRNATVFVASKDHNGYMNDKVQEMQITLNPEQTARLLEWAGRTTHAEMEADCDASGYTLEISIMPGMRWAEAVGRGRIDLGAVDVQLIDKDTH